MSVAFRLACCLCGKPIPLSQDVYALDAEWQRRYPAMRGILAGQDCALRTGWHCVLGYDAQGARTYAPEHIPARSRCDDDAWSHVLGFGTHIGMVQKYPRSALLQGAEPYLRNSARRRGTAPAVAARLRALLQEWEACAMDERLERFGRFPGAGANSALPGWPGAPGVDSPRMAAAGKTGLMSGPNLPPADEPMTVEALLARWPTGVEKAELIRGVMLFTGDFDERDLVIAQRAYPGRRVLLNVDHGVEVHPAGSGPARSILDVQD